LAGRHDNHKILFSLVVFEEWLRTREQLEVCVNSSG